MRTDNQNVRANQSHRFDETNMVRFETAEELWFWFIAAQAARNDGARYVSGASVVSRPCEPVDVLKVLDDLYRKRRLMRDHLLVLRHYGRRYLSPDPSRVKEVHAYYLWIEALERMEPIFMRKGLIEKTMSFYPAAHHNQSDYIMAAE